MSELRANTISDAAGTGPATLTGQSAAKMWGKFTPIAVVGGFNLGSFTDNGTGDYTVSITNAFASFSDANCPTSHRGTGNAIAVSQFDSTTSWSINVLTPNTAAYSDAESQGSGFGDLA